MKGITELDTIQFLKRCNEIRKIADDCITNTGILEIRKRHPVFTGKETKEEIEAANVAQAKKNISAMLDACLEQHPEETARLLDALLVYDPGEEHLTGIRLVSRAKQELMDKDVTDFFLSAAKLAFFM